LAKNIQKLINVQDGIRACRMDFFQKRIRFAARLLRTLEYLQILKKYILESNFKIMNITKFSFEWYSIIKVS
jgi:hypothetical protein